MAIFNPDGNEFDGSCNSVIIGSDTIPSLSATYADGLDTGDVVSMGNQGIDAVTQGIYKRDEAKIKFRSSIFRVYLMPLFRQNGFGNQRFQIVVVKTHPDIGDDSDLLNNCRCVNVSASIEASNKGDEVETVWKIGKGGIAWTDERKTIFNAATADAGGFSISAIFNF
jgi:hypothetical protein